jgi:outer membrane protein assembly factor BamB
MHQASKDGSEVWSYPLGSAIIGAPTIAGDRLYLGTVDGTIYAFQLE